MKTANYTASASRFGQKNAVFLRRTNPRRPDDTVWNAVTLFESDVWTLKYLEFIAPALFPDCNLWLNDLLMNTTSDTSLMIYWFKDFGNDAATVAAEEAGKKHLIVLYTLKQLCLYVVQFISALPPPHCLTVY